MDGMLEGGSWLGDGREDGLRAGARRRRWSAARKAVIVAESCVAGATVSEVAARHGVNANMLSAWRRQALARGKSTGNASKDAPTSAALPFVPVRVVAAGSRPDALADVRTAGGAIEILVGDASIRVAKGVDAATLSRVLAAVRGGRR